MKGLLKFILVIVCIGIFKPAFAQEESESLFSYGAEASIQNKYVWRGLVYNEGTILQPSAWLSKDNFTAQVWGNWTLHDTNGNPAMNEIDYYLWYDFPLGDLTITPIIMYYTYPNQDALSTGEIGIGAAYALDKFEFGTTANLDFKEASGALSVEHSVKYETGLSELSTFSAFAALGWADKKFNNYYIGTEKAALNYLQLNFSLSYAVSEEVSIKPFAAYYKILDSEITALIDDHIVNYGILISAEF
jgi:hypothetical protein